MLARYWFRIRHPRAYRAIRRRLGIEDPGYGPRAMVAYRWLIVATITGQLLARALPR